MSAEGVQVPPAAPTAVPASPTEVKKLLATAKSNLSAQLAKKKQLDKELMNVESTLYQFETSYLAPPPDPSLGPSFGNIVKGYDSYLKAPNATLGLSERKRIRTNQFGPDIRPEDRLFSTSSETYQRALELKGNEPSAVPNSMPLEEPPISSDEEGHGGHKRKRRH